MSQTEDKSSAFGRIIKSAADALYRKIREATRQGDPNEMAVLEARNGRFLAWALRRYWPQVEALNAIGELIDQRPTVH